MQNNIIMKKIVFLLVVGLITFNLQAQNNQRSIKVVGEAMIKVIPEQTTFRIPLKIIDPSYMECSNSLRETLDKLQTDLLRQGISKDKVHADQYTISENMVYENGKRIQQGFKGSVSVVVSDIYSQEFVYKVLGSVDKYKLSYAIDFSLSPEQKDVLSKEAITKAVEDATQKAHILAEASKLPLGEIILISYGERNFMPGPLTQERMEISTADFKNSNELNLNPPSTHLAKKVTIVWQIK